MRPVISLPRALARPGSFASAVQLSHGGSRLTTRNASCRCRGRRRQRGRRVRRPRLGQRRRLGRRLGLGPGRRGRAGVRGARRRPRDRRRRAPLALALADARTPRPLDLDPPAPRVDDVPPGAAVEPVQEARAQHGPGEAQDVARGQEAARDGRQEGQEADDEPHEGHKGAVGQVISPSRRFLTVVCTVCNLSFCPLHWSRERKSETCTASCAVIRSTARRSSAS